MDSIVIMDKKCILLVTIISKLEDIYDNRNMRK